jgi:cysteine desulfurase
LGCRPAEIIFTSGGTESNNYAVKGAALAAFERGNHVVTSAVEHPAVVEVCRWLETQGFRVTVLPVDGTGLVSPADLEEAITPQTTLVSVMHANNEVGTIQPIAELAAIAHAHGTLMHTDAAQSIGKIPVDVDELNVDLLSVAAHKLYAPKGIGALFVRDGVLLTPLIHGAGQESGRRPGTENVLEIVGLGKAAEIAARDLERNRRHFRDLRDRLYQGLIAELGSEAVRLNGHPEKRLPNTLSLSFHEVEASTLLVEISDRVAVSAGAACHADSTEISAVLQAMQVPLDWAMGTLRFSVGRDTTDEQIDETVDVVAEAVRELWGHTSDTAK